MSVLAVASFCIFCVAACRCTGDNFRMQYRNWYRRYFFTYFWQ